MKGLQIAIAALGGAVVGAAAALLLAPQEGKRTRSQIREYIREKCPFIHESRVDEIADQLEEEIKEKLDHTLATAKNK